MAEFPSRLTARIEMAFGADKNASSLTWDWTDVTTYLASTDPGINVALRGRSGEMDQVQPSSCTFTLDNRSGDFTPTLTTSAFYPNLVQGTPCRVYIDLPDDLSPVDMVDTFQRTVPVTTDPALSNWGVSDSLHRYYVSDDVDETEFSVTPGNAVVEALAWSSKHQMLEVSYRDFDAYWTVSPQQLSTGTSGTASSLAYRSRFVDMDLTDFAQVSFRASNQVWVRFDVSGSVVNVNSGLTYAAMDWFEVRVQVRDNKHRIKVWALGDPEPSAWTYEHTATSSNVYGAAGLGIVVFTGASTPNTLHYGTFSIAPKDPVFYGEVSALTPTWPWGDLSRPGYDGESFTSVEVAGVLRRLGQGSQTLDSAMRRGLLRRDPQAVAYWHMEDGVNAVSFASGLVGPQYKPMSRLGTITPAQESGFIASAALPTFGANARATGVIPAYTPSGFVRVMWLMKTPNGGWPNASYILRLTGTGTIATWTVRVSNIGEIRLRGFDGDGVEVFTGSLVNFGLNDQYVAAWLYLEQQGSNIATQFGTFNQTTAATGVFNQNVTNQTVGRLTTVTVGDPNNNMNDGSFGHVMVLNDAGFWSMVQFMNAWKDERAFDRVERLCQEEGVPLRIRGLPTDTPMMGYQEVRPLLELLHECAAADGGLLYEPKGEGLAYRSRRNLYNQQRALILDAKSSGHKGDIINPLVPTFDDENLINRATFSSDEGTSFTAEDTDSIGLSGLYDTSETINVTAEADLRDAAEHKVFLGTWPGMRYPSVSPAFDVNADILRQWQVRDIGDPVVVSNLPPQHPVGQVELIMQGYTESIHPVRWGATMNCTPGLPWEVGQIPESPSIGTPTRLGTQLSTVDTSFSESDTSVSVATGDGFLWITTALHPGEFPFNIKIGDEVLEVTAVSGTTSPQTFTVLRGSDAQPHTAGDRVTIDPAARVAR